MIDTSSTSWFVGTRPRRDAVGLVGYNNEVYALAVDNTLVFSMLTEHCRSNAARKPAQVLAHCFRG